MVLPHCKHCKGFVVDFYLAKLTTLYRVVFCCKNILKKIKNFYKKVLTSIKKYVIMITEIKK